MTAPNDFLERLLTRAGARSDTHTLRAASIARLRATGLPYREKLEAFKYTPITAFYGDDLLDGEASAPGIHFAGADVPAGVTIARSARAMVATASNHPLAHVNGSLLEEIVDIVVADGCEVPAPLHIAHAPAGRCTRIEVRLGRGSRLNIVEHHTDIECSSNRVLRIELAEASNLSHQRLDVASGEGAAWALLHATVGSAASYELDHYVCGAKPRRNEVVVDLRGRGAGFDLASAVIAGGRYAADQQITVNHFGVDTRSRQLVHGIAAGKGQLTFNGRIEIHPEGDGANATLTSRNLLLAPTARINAKPELEIHTRNVACSHGATVGQLDDAQLFYLRSRGITEADARQMLTRAFLLRAITPAAAALGVDAILTAAIAP